MKAAMLFFLATVSFFTSVAYGAPWNLPQELSDKNVDINYTIDATWRLLEGRATGVRGTASLANLYDPNSIRADLTIPSTEFDTGTSAPGRVLGEMLKTRPMPTVLFSILNTELRCATETLAPGRVCTGFIDGRATVRGSSRNVRVPIEVKKIGEDFTVSGTRQLTWGEYGLGDPAHWIAKLNPIITMNFSIRLGLRK